MDNVFLIYKINGAESVNDLQSRATANANALEIISEITSKAAKLMLIEKGYPQDHEIRIMEAVKEADTLYGESSAYIVGDACLFKFECKYE